MNMNLPSAIQALEPSRSPFYKLREGPDFFRVPVEVIGITNFTSSIKKKPGTPIGFREDSRSKKSTYAEGRRKC